jgi:hypothetical protein
LEHALHSAIANNVEIVLLNIAMSTNNCVNLKIV